MVTRKLDLDPSQIPEIDKNNVIELGPPGKDGLMAKFTSAKKDLLSIERKLTAKKIGEYAVPIDFPLQWDSATPVPQLLVNGSITVLIFDLHTTSTKNDGIERIAVVRFHNCVSVRMGSPNSEALHNHPLRHKGLMQNTAHLVHASRWIAELESMNKGNSQLEQDSWKKLSHYIFTFRDGLFECVALSYNIETSIKNKNGGVVDVSK
ncbi:MAG TPA: hypothetical protein VN376_06330 [Longilinea sp.]|nr:hypothetical protein [Longilinea sp.]